MLGERQAFAKFGLENADRFLRRCALLPRDPDCSGGHVGYMGTFTDAGGSFTDANFSTSMHAYQSKDAGTLPRRGSGQ